MAPDPFRHESKFFINAHQYQVLRQRLRHLLRPDVEAQMKNLRKRLALVTDRQYLQTRRGLGYVLEENPT